MTTQDKKSKKHSRYFVTGNIATDEGRKILIQLMRVKDGPEAIANVRDELYAEYKAVNRYIKSAGKIDPLNTKKMIDGTIAIALREAIKDMIPLYDLTYAIARNQIEIAQNLKRLVTILSAGNNKEVNALKDDIYNRQNIVTREELALISKNIEDSSKVATWWLKKWDHDKVDDKEAANQS